MSNIINTRAKTAKDEDLKYVTLCQKGDTESFDVLVERHQKKSESPTCDKARTVSRCVHLPKHQSVA